MTPEQAEEREAMLEDRAKGKREDALIELQDTRVCHAGGDECPGCPHYYGKADVCRYAPKEGDALIESGVLERFLRGGFECASFPGGQLITDQEHGVVCAHIEYLTKQLQWISVDERLPENGLPVLMAGSHDEPVTGYLAAARMNWYTYEDDDYVVGITHWMPIPPQDKNDG